MKRTALHFSCLNCIKDVYLEPRVRVGVVHHVVGINGNESGLNFYRGSSRGMHIWPTDWAVHGGEGRNQWKQWGSVYMQKLTREGSGLHLQMSHLQSLDVRSL